MNKGQLVEAIAKAAELSKKDAQAALEATIVTIQKSLKKKDNVTLIESCNRRKNQNQS